MMEEENDFDEPSAAKPHSPKDSESVVSGSTKDRTDISRPAERLRDVATNLARQLQVSQEQHQRLRDENQEQQERAERAADRLERHI